MKFRVWSQQVERGDVVIDRGCEREVKAVRRNGRGEIVLVFKDGAHQRVDSTASLVVERKERRSHAR
ncbi:hypothetical protein [Streptomyces syringium]|uniref:hypothetical protein n=1 Tax=Streptomyces syringium TaxID=76729 RepID=UPI003452A42C